MNLFDAESHIKENDHKSLKAKEEGENKVISREDAEEALFLNEFKEIKPGVFKGRRVFSCEKCRANNLPIEPMKKHVMSLIHKKNHKTSDNFAEIDQECKEMKKKGRNSISYLCTPCGFTSDSVIATKNHIREEGHRKRCTNYCHACKQFSANKGKFTEHRFSIAHKRIMAELEKPFEEKEQEKHKEAKEKRRIQRKEDEEKEKAAAVPAEPEDPLKCSWCNFEAEDLDEMKAHRKTESCRRKYYLKFGKMPSQEDEEEAEGEAEDKPFTSLEHMGLVHKAKDIADKAKNSRSLTVDEDVKKQKNEIIDTLFTNNIFEKLSETTIKCTTCEVKLQGHAQKKKLYAQLFMHFTSEKHIQRLRIQVKGEEAAENAPPEEQVEVEDVPEETNENNEEQMAVPDPLTLSIYQDYTDDEGIEMFNRLRLEEDEDEDNLKPKRMCDLVNRTCLLLYCKICKTGLMSGKYMARHFDSKECKEKLPPNPWRTMLDLSFIFEFGHLYKCLIGNTGFMNLQQLEIYLRTKDHKKRMAEVENETALLDMNIPDDPPRCDVCNR